MESSLGGHHVGKLHRQAAEAKAEGIIAQELQRNGWYEQELQTRRKHDPAKREIAARLRNETTLSIKEIAARVCFMKSFIKPVAPGFGCSILPGYQGRKKNTAVCI